MTDIKIEPKGLLPSPVAAKALRDKAVYGVQIPVADGVDVVVADNIKDYTGPGTNTYLVGKDRLWVIDPGPADAAHIEAVVSAVGGRPVQGILVTHNHLDHSPAAAPLSDRLDAPVYGYGGLPEEIQHQSDEDIDPDFVPDRALMGGETVGEGRWRLQVLHTPGHFPNHLCYRLPDAGIIFSGDHVMGWSTTVIVPPLGNLADYMDSLDLLARAGAVRLMPSHGDPVDNALSRIEEVRAHRMMRQTQVEECLHRGMTDPADIVDVLYDGLTPRLLRAAEGCVAAHIELYTTRRAQAERVQTDVVQTEHLEFSTRRPRTPPRYT